MMLRVMRDASIWVEKYRNEEYEQCEVGEICESGWVDWDDMRCLRKYILEGIS